MVDVAVDEQRGSAPRGARLRWRSLWVIAPALFLVFLGVTRIVYWRTSIAYAPLRFQGLVTPAIGQPVHVQTSSNGLSLNGPAGTDQLFEFPVLNDGDSPVDINRVTVEDEAIAGVQWSANHLRDGQRVPSPSHELPVRVPGHAIVNLQIVVRRPVCTATFGRYLSGQVTIHWHAMISPHATTVNLLADDPTYISLCPSR